MNYLYLELGWAAGLDELSIPWIGMSCRVGWGWSPWFSFPINTTLCDRWVSLFKILNSLINLNFHPCTFIHVLSSMYFHPCTFIHVLSSMYFHPLNKMTKYQFLSSKIFNPSQCCLFSSRINISTLKSQLGPYLMNWRGRWTIYESLWIIGNSGF